MPDVQANVQIKAVDDASDTLQKIYEAVQRIEEGHKKAAEAIGQFNLANIVTIATGVSAANALDKTVSSLIQFGESSLQAASDMQLIGTRAEVLYGKDFPAMKDQIDGMAEAFGRNASDLMGSSVSLSAFSESLGVSKAQAETMGTQLTGLSVEFQKAFGGSQEDAASALERALNGNARALINYDTALKPATLDAYLLSKGYDAQFNSLDQSSKALAIYHYLMDNTKDIQAAAAKNTGDFADETERLHAAWKGFSQDFGTFFLPAATGVLSALDAVIQKVEQTKGIVSMFGLIDAADRGLLGLNNQKTQSYDDMIAGSLGGPGNAQDQDFTKALQKDTGGGADKAAKKLEEMKQKVLDLGASYEDAEKTIKDKMDSITRTHEQDISTLNDQFQGLQDQIKSTNQSYADFVRDAATESEDLVGKAGTRVQDLEDRLSSLQQRARDENNRGSISVATNEEMAKVQKELDQAKTAQTSLTAGLTSAQQTDAARRAALTPEQRQAEDNKAKDSDEAAKHAATLQKIQEEITKNQEKQKTDDVAFKAAQTQYKNTESAFASFHDRYILMFGNMAKITDDQVKFMIGRIKDLKDSFDTFGTDKSKSFIRTMQLSTLGSQ